MTEQKIPNFYCHRYSGCGSLDIETWNRRYKRALDMNMNEAQRRKYLEEDYCASQCFECLTIVAETRSKNSISTQPL